MRSLLLFIYLLLQSSFSHAADTAQVSVKPPVVVRLDSNLLRTRHFDAKQLKAYQNEKAFSYDELAPASESIWERFWKWFWRLVESLFGNETSGKVLKYIVIGAFVALVTFLIVKLAGIELFQFSKKSKALAVPYQEVQENIHEINFNEEIESATAKGNYRLAIRLLYLLSLKKLTDRQLIHWLPEKTNQAYLDEIENEPTKSGFAMLTRQFEYVWYGDFQLNKEAFLTVRLSFEQFNSELR